MRSRGGGCNICAYSNAPRSNALLAARSSMLLVFTIRSARHPSLRPKPSLQHPQPPPRPPWRAPVKGVKVGVLKRLADLHHAVGAEVEQHHRVAVLHGAHRLAVVADDDKGGQVLVRRRVLGVALGWRRGWSSCMGARGGAGDTKMRSLEARRLTLRLTAAQAAAPQARTRTPLPRRTRSVLTAVSASLNWCGALPSTCASHPVLTMFQSAS